jgi:hypothetical protein
MGNGSTWLAPVAGVALVALGPAGSCRRAREERSIVDAAVMLKWGANACRLSGSMQISNCESGRGEEASTGSKRAGGILVARPSASIPSPQTDDLSSSRRHTFAALIAAFSLVSLGTCRVIYN